jgi:hypothetical protein
MHALEIRTLCSYSHSYLNVTRGQKTEDCEKSAKIEEVEHVLKQCSGLLDTSSPKLNELVANLRAVRDRFADNANKSEAVSCTHWAFTLFGRQGYSKLGSLCSVLPINAAMNDIKKLMRESQVDAIPHGDYIVFTGRRAKHGA